MYTNKTCTLYLKSNNYTKMEIECFFTQRTIANLSKQGMSYPETAFIMADVDEEFTPGEDYVIEGECDLTIDTTSEASFSSSLKLLKATKRFYTIMCADKKQYGTSFMRHVELSCK